MRSWHSSCAVSRLPANLRLASEPACHGVRCVGVPTFLMTVVNEDFLAENEEELSDAAAAAEQAIKGALAMGAEQVLAGKRFFGAEVVVSDGNSRERFLVAVGASPIK